MFLKRTSQKLNLRDYSVLKYSAVHGVWPVERLAKLADKSARFVQVARGGCSCAWNLIVTRSTLLMEAEGRIR